LLLAYEYLLEIDTVSLLFDDSSLRLSRVVSSEKVLAYEESSWSWLAVRPELFFCWRFLAIS
jgi:hypothetical protein